MKNLVFLVSVLAWGCQNNQQGAVESANTKDSATVEVQDTIIPTEIETAVDVVFPELVPDGWPFDPPVFVDGVRYPNLETAMAEVSDNSTVELESGIYSQKIMLDGLKGVKISSVGGPALFIVGQLQESFITVENCQSISVSDLFFSVDNYYDLPDDLGTITINNCADVKIERCAMYRSCVGIYAQNSTGIAIEKCVMRGMNGSGVWLEDCEGIRVSHCRFSCKVPIMGGSSEYKLVDFDTSEGATDEEVLNEMQTLDSVDLVLFKNWMGMDPFNYDASPGISAGRGLGYTVVAQSNVVIGDFPKAWSDWSVSNTFTHYDSLFTKLEAPEAYRLWWLSLMDETFRGKTLNTFGAMVLTPNFGVDFLRETAKNQNPDILFPGSYYGTDELIQGLKGKLRRVVGPKGLVETTLNLMRTGDFDHFGDTGSVFRLSTVDSCYFILEPDYYLGSDKVQVAEVAADASSYRMGVGSSEWGRVPFEDQLYRIVLGNDTSYLKIYGGKLLSCAVFKDKNGVQGLLNDFTELNGENDAYFGLKELLWAGDLNGDDMPDLIIDVSDMCDNPFVLLISGLKGYTPKYQRVLNYTPCGC